LCLTSKQFFIFGSSIAFGYAALRTNIDTEIAKQKLLKGGALAGNISSGDLWKLSQIEFVTVSAPFIFPL
jgi:hypothetical protein